RATAATVAILAGTMVLLFASNVFGHALAGLLGFASWCLVSDERPLTPGRLALAGLAAGSAVAAEYPLAVVAALVGAYVLLTARGRVVWFALGALPGAGLLLA